MYATTAEEPTNTHIETDGPQRMIGIRAQRAVSSCASRWEDEAVTVTEDATRKHREWLLSFVPRAEALSFVDLGCGRGADLLALAAQRVDPSSRFVGVDVSPEAAAAAQSAAGDDPRVETLVADLDPGLPFDDDAFDCVFSHNLLECLCDEAAFAAELARVLRPGGSVVVAHWDWDTQLFDASDRTLVRRLVQAFSDRQQAWMNHVDPWAGRRLWGLFNASRAFRGEVRSHTLVETSFVPGSYGYDRANDFLDLVEEGAVSAAECERFLAEQRQLHSQGRYFYAITGFAYVGRRAS